MLLPTAAAAGAAPFTLAASPHSPATQPYDSSRSFFGRDRAGSLSSVLTDDAPPGEAAVQLLPGDSAVRSARRRSNTRIAPLPMAGHRSSQRRGREEWLPSNLHGVYVHANRGSIDHRVRSIEESRLVASAMRA